MALVQHMIRQHERISTESKKELGEYLTSVTRRLDDTDKRVEKMQKSFRETQASIESNAK